jgi:hypothetical protein
MSVKKLHKNVFEAIEDDPVGAENKEKKEITS